MTDAPAASSTIVTLTLNPSLDVSLRVNQVVPHDKLRTDRPRYEPGGGGLNVSRVCRRLGEHTTAVVPIGGHAGQRLLELLSGEGHAGINEVSIIDIAGDTRQSVAVRSLATGEQYRFVLPGPQLVATEVERCREAVVRAAVGSHCLVVSGSTPPGVDPSFIPELIAAVDCPVIVDTSREALAAALRSGAYLVKPSVRELATVLNTELDTEADVAEAARTVMDQSSISVLVVSIGPGGAMALTDGQTYRLRAPAVKVASAVGAGDSMVGGFAVGLNRGDSLLDLLRLGVAAGSAAVMTAGTELCRASDVERLLPLVSID